MRIIAHRGNLYGPGPLENTVGGIISAIEAGFYVEVDVWYKDHCFWLGHDKPERPVDSGMLYKPRAYLHFKNFAAYVRTPDNFSSMEIVGDTFFHEHDTYTRTARGFIWTAQEPEIITDQIILVLNDLSEFKPEYRKLGGICTDYPIKLKEMLGSCE